MKTYSSMNTIRIIGWKESSTDQPPAPLTAHLVSLHYAHTAGGGAVEHRSHPGYIIKSHLERELAPEAGRRLSGAHPYAGTEKRQT